ncbi:hypothetical protein F7725_003903 [Dissostichus mawsoni]|uniref:Uncharacterized protein n=1 Tax=Dissostichus mawsoni TaxID=36200 RepID=A0A7J5YBM9_DISMA|nr:hypothetical protein F7725_003903 [Dissostichus mawsoni]
MEKGRKGFEEERKGVPGPIGGRERGQQTAGGGRGVREHAGLLTRAIVLRLEMIVALIALFVSLAVASGLMFSGSSRGETSRESAKASRARFCHPVQMPRFCPLSPSLYLSGVIDPSHQLVLISFTPKEDLVCGQTAHYGGHPEALQGGELTASEEPASLMHFLCPSLPVHPICGATPLSPERSISVQWSFPLPCWSPCRRTEAFPDLRSGSLCDIDIMHILMCLIIISIVSWSAVRGFDDLRDLQRSVMMCAEAEEEE